jgi:hypothetical protein
MGISQSGHHDSAAALVPPSACKLRPLSYLMEPSAVVDTYLAAQNAGQIDRCMELTTPCSMSAEDITRGKITPRRS